MGGGSQISIFRGADALRKRREEYGNAINDIQRNGWFSASSHRNFIAVVRCLYMILI
jgi:hypothetical protein